MGKIRIVKSLQDVMDLYHSKETVRPEDYENLVQLLAEYKNLQENPTPVRLRKPITIPVLKPSQVALQQADSDYLDDQIDDFSYEDHTRYQNEMERQQLERQLLIDQENRNFLNWLNHPATTLKAEMPPKYNPDEHGGLSGFRWQAKRLLPTFAQPQHLTGSRALTQSPIGYELLEGVDRGKETLPGFEEGYKQKVFDKYKPRVGEPTFPIRSYKIPTFSGTWVSPPDIQSLGNPDVSQNITDDQHLLGILEGNEPNYYRPHLAMGDSGIMEGYQYGGYDPSSYVSIPLPAGIHGPVGMSRLISQAYEDKDSPQMQQLIDWGIPKGIPEISRTWQQNKPATFDELNEAGYFKVASEDNPFHDALTLLKEKVNINHDNMEDDFKNDIMTLDRNHTIDKDKQGFSVDNVTPEMKKVIELMARNMSNKPAMEKKKDKRPFFS